MVNLDRIFPTPSAKAKAQDILRKVNYTPSDSDYGTSLNASVTIVEFSDFLCPACAVASEAVHEILDYYGDDVNFIFKHFPAHDGSQNAAVASECARDQGKFWEYHDLLFNNFGKVGLSSLQSYAGSLGLDMDQFNLCLSSGEKLQKVQDDFNDGREFPIKGTPTFIVNDAVLTGAYSFDEFKPLIDLELQNG
jgi:protein-disulfide isomerase